MVCHLEMEPDLKEREREPVEVWAGDEEAEEAAKAATARDQVQAETASVRNAVKKCRTGPVIPAMKWNVLNAAPGW